MKYCNTAGHPFYASIISLHEPETCLCRGTGCLPPIYHDPRRSETPCGTGFATYLMHIDSGGKKKKATCLTGLHMRSLPLVHLTKQPLWRTTLLVPKAFETLRFRRKPHLFLMKAITLEILIFCLGRRVIKTHWSKLSVWPRNDNFRSNQLAPNFGGLHHPNHFK